MAQKHREYYRSALCYRTLYYGTRLFAGISAGSLPFVIHTSATIATALSLIIVAATVLDVVFSPKDRWALFSKGTDLLFLAQLKASGQSKEWEDALEAMQQTEWASLQQTTNLRDMLALVRNEANSTKPQGTPSA